MSILLLKKKIKILGDVLVVFLFFVRFVARRGTLGSSVLMLSKSLWCLR